MYSTVPNPFFGHILSQIGPSISLPLYPPKNVRIQIPHQCQCTPQLPGGPHSHVFIWLIHKLMLD